MRALASEVLDITGVSFLMGSHPRRDQLYWEQSGSDQPGTTSSNRCLYNSCQLLPQTEKYKNRSLGSWKVWQMKDDITGSIETSNGGGVSLAGSGVGIGEATLASASGFNSVCAICSCSCCFCCSNALRFSSSCSFSSLCCDVSKGCGSLAFSLEICSQTVLAIQVKAVQGAVRGRIGKVRRPSRHQS